MQDCMNIKEVKLAQAGIASSMGAAKRRGPLAFLLAVIFLAAALLFAMPSLAHAEEAQGAQPASPSQEILLSQKESSTSVNVAPDEPKAPPAYSQQDAFNSALEGKSSGVDVVSGADASADGSYTTGDNKSSSDSKDSGDDSDDSSEKPSYPEGDSIINTDNNMAEDSTVNSDGASSGSNTDELATDDSNHQSAQPTGDSKADDVIATPGDKGSADQTAGADSDKSEEVQAGQAGSNVAINTITVVKPVEVVSDNTITVNPAGVGNKDIIVHFNQIYTSKPTIATYTTAMVNLPAGAANDPIFTNDTSYLQKAGTDLTITAGGAANPAANAVAMGLDKNGSNVYNIRYGFTLTQWLFIATNKTTGAKQVLTQMTFQALSTFTGYSSTGAVYDVEAYPIVMSQRKSANYVDKNNMAITGAAGTYNYYDVPISAEDKGYTLNAGYQWLGQQYAAPKTLADATLDNTTATLGDWVDSIFHFRNSTASYDATYWNAINIVEKEKPATEYTISFKVGSSDTGKVTVTGSDIKVNNNGTTKPTAAQITGAGASATDANNKDGWVQDGTKWQYTMGATSATINSLADLANIAITANMTVSPVMKELTGFTVNLNGGKAVGQTGFTPGATTLGGGTTKFASPTLTFSNPTWTGYTFKGWFTTAQTTIGQTGGTLAYAGGASATYSDILTKVYGAAGAQNVETTNNVTLYAWWDAVGYTITYNGNQPANGGTVANVPATQNTSHGSSATISNNTPTSNGFNFTGWNTAANGSGTAYAKGATIPSVTGNIALYAQWSEKTGYKVTFYDKQTATADGTAFNTQQNLNWTGNVTVPANPTAPAGYSFGGWYTQKSGTTATGTQMTGTMTYKNLLAAVNSALTDSTMEIKMYAKWTELGKLTFTMDLNAGGSATYNGGTANYTNSNVLYNGNATIPNVTNPSRVGYNFKGWSDTAGGAVNAAYTKGATVGPMTANKTIYAVWQAAPVTLTYKQGPTGDIAGVTNKASSSSAYTVNTNYATNVTVPAGATMYDRPGYTFSNWAFAKKTSGTGSVATAGGSLNFATSDILISWTGSSEDGTLTGTAVVYPNWTAISYTIVWNTQGGNTIANTTGLNGDSSISTPSTPTRAGYTFQKWVTVATNDTTVGSGSKDVVSGNKLRDTWTLTAGTTTLNAYAIWKENIVEVKFVGDSNAGVAWGDASALTSGSIVYVGAATGMIYNASGVAQNKNISTGINPNITNGNYEWKVYTSGNDATYTSKWTTGSRSGASVTAAWVNTTTGKLTLGKGASGLYESADYYLTVSPKKYNYTIEYYNQNVADNNYTLVTNPAGSGTQFFGHAVTAGTTAGASGTTLTVVPATQTGFTRNPSAPGAVNTVTIAATGNVLKFYYTRNTYTVTASYTGNRPAGTEYSPATQTVKYGVTVTLNVPTAPAGYSFSGWSATPNATLTGTGATRTFTMPANNVTATGTWGVQTVNVTFTVNSSLGSLNVTAPNGAASQNVTFGSTLSAIPGVVVNNTASNYFMGWALYTNCTTAGNASTGTLGRIYTKDEIIGTGAYAGNAWVVPAGNSVFVATIMPTLAVEYVAGTGGAFANVTGSVSGKNVQTGGTIYQQLQSSADDPMALPKFCVNTAGAKNTIGNAANAWQTAGDTRNTNNPKATDGYKFKGWTWKDTKNNVTKTAYGSYNAAGVFVKTSGDDMPTEVDQSYTFTGIWEKTWQQLHFVNTCVNGTGVTGGAAPADVVAQLGTACTLPTASNYASTTSGKPASAYTFKGWTTVQSYTSSSPLYNTTFTMTAGTQSTSVYTMAQAAADGGYGVTLYPVFEEKSTTINYALATGVTGVMATLDKTSENIKMVTGAAAGSTATAKTGYVFKGWFTDAAHTTPVTAAWVTSGKITPAKAADGAYAGTTYYAYFEAEKYDITFKVGDQGTWQTPAGGTTDKVSNLAYNTAYGTFPTVVANTGYGLQGWKDASGTIKTAALWANEKVTGPMTFTAVWEARNGFTLAFDTMGGAPTLASKQVTWTASIATSMDSSSSNIKRQGYTFAGWYAKNDFSAGSLISTALNCAGATDTFATGITKSGQTVTGDTATLTLYAKWNPNTYTIKYDPHWPKTSSTTFADRTAQWPDTNLLPTGGETLTMDGFTFTGWVAKNGAKTFSVTNAAQFADMYVALFGATDYSTTKTITIEAQWGTKTYNVIFQDPSGATLKTESNKNWDDSINYYAYTVADGSKRLLGWKYTPVGGTQQSWTSGTATKLVSAIGGDPAQATNGKTYILVADLQDNAKYEIRFHKVNLKADGTPDIAGATVVAGATKTGFATPGVAIDIKNFNSTNYITAFENQNGAGRRPDLKGYALDETLAGTKIVATTAEMLSGQTTIFKVYWVEKIFDIQYNLGASVIGSKPYAGTDPAPAAKKAGWNSTNIMPDTTPTWEGYKAPKWIYQNAAGQWVLVPAGAKVSDIAKSDDNTLPIILKAQWDSDLARLTYAAQTGGSAKNSTNTFTVNAGTSGYQDIDAVNGTPYTMTATAASGYIFTGWYKAGVLLTTDATFTPQKVDGLFSSVTYEARFRALGSIQYTIKHFFEELDGTYTHDATKDATRGGQEFATINVTNDMKLSVKGFTWKNGITGEKLTIASLVNGEELKLYYARNSHDVYVQPSRTGADAPTPVPAPVYTATGITQAHTTHKYGATLTLPTITAPDGWGFKWEVSYRDSGTSTSASATYNNGATITMPDADVDVIGIWERFAHKVTFNAGDNPHGTVTVKNGKVLPFTVTHGKNMTDAASSGNANDINVNPDAAWAHAGWEYADETGATHVTRDPNSVIINCDTTFKALWAQTFYVAYSPTNHGGTGFTTLYEAGNEIVIGTNVNGFKLKIGGVDKTANAPAAAGYRFVGWTWTHAGTTNYWITPSVTDYDTTGLAGTAAEMDFPLAGNVTFNAIWEAMPQNLYYKLDHGSPQSEWTATGAAAGTAGDTYEQLPSPRTDQVVTLLTGADVTRAGYAFKGWVIWTDANGNNTVDAGELGSVITGTYKMPAHSVTFVPVWDFDSIRVYFKIETGSNGKGTLSVTDEAITDGNKARLDGSVATANAGYRFDGWYSDPACTVAVDPSWILSGTRLSAMKPADGWVTATYYAKFVPGIAPYTIEYYLQNLDGTYTMKTSTRFSDVNTEDYADVTDPANAAYTHLLDTTTGTYKGYNFNQTVPESILRVVVKGDGTSVLKVYYDRTPFNITYDLGTNGAAVGAWQSTEGPRSAIAESTVSFPAPVLDGMQHTGWKVTWTDPTSGATVEKTFGIGGSFEMPFTDVKAIAVYVKWVPVIIEYYYEGATGNVFIDRETIEKAQIVGERYTAPAENVRAHRPSGYSNPATLPSMIVADDPENPNILKVIYRRIAEYKLKFDPNGATTGSAVTVSDLALTDKPAQFEPTHFKKTGYILNSMPKRWNTQADGKGVWLTPDTTYEQIAEAILGKGYDDATLSKTILTVYAMWSIDNGFVVKYDLNNDMETNKNILKKVPEWRNPKVIDDKTGVTWFSKGFDILSDEELDAAPAGYVFDGWNTKADGTGLKITDLTLYSEMSDYINRKVAQRSITLYAQWKELFVKIEYVTDGGGTVDRTIDNVSAATGQHVGQGSSAGERLHSVATPKPGYHFVGWELYDEKTHGALRAAAADLGVNQWNTIRDDKSEFLVLDPAADGRLYAATYIARFEKNADATITYDPNKGEGTIEPTVFTHGLPVDLSDGTGFKRGHHTLIGWNTKEDGTGTDYDLGYRNLIMPEGGLKLYAQWSINSYDVHAVGRDDEIGTVIGGDTKVEWGKPLPPEYIASLSATAKPNSTFKGWRYTMVDADTGETHTGLVTDLNELKVLGPLTLEGEFETQPAPEPPAPSPVPRTGDTRDFTGLIVLAVAALIAGIVMMLVIRRRREENEEIEVVENTKFEAAYEMGAGRIAGIATAVASTGRRRRRVKVCGVFALALACVCMLSALQGAPGLAYADANGTTSSPNIHVSTAAQTDPVTSSTGSFQSKGPLAGYVGGSSSAPAATNQQKVASCGTVGSSSSSNRGSTAGYVGSGSPSTGGNAVNSSASAGYVGSSATSAATGYGSVQYVPTGGYVAGSTGTYITTSGPKAGYVGSTITNTGTKAGYVGDSYRVVPVGDNYTPLVYSAPAAAGATTYVAAVDTRAALLSRLAHSAGDKIIAAKTIETYENSAVSSIGLGDLYYGAARDSLSARAGALTCASAGFDGKARDFSALGNLSLKEAANLSSGMRFIEGILNGTLTDIAAHDTFSSTNRAELVADAIDAHNRLMASSISPNANALSAAYMLVGVADALAGSGTLPMSTDEETMVFPDLGEARLRDEEMSIETSGLVPDVLGEALAGADPSKNTLMLPSELDGETSADETVSGETPGDETTGGETTGGDAGSETPNPDTGGETGSETPNPDSGGETENPGSGETGSEMPDPGAGGDTGSETPDPGTGGETGSETPDPGAGGESDGEGEGDVGQEPGDNPGDEPGASYDPDAFIFNLDINGGTLDDLNEKLEPTYVSKGKPTTLTAPQSLVKPGYTFLCWNTQKDGMGVPIYPSEQITDLKLATMFALNDLKNEKGAATTLYARWKSNEPPAPPASNPSTNSGSATNSGSETKKPTKLPGEGIPRPNPPAATAAPSITTQNAAATTTRSYARSTWSPAAGGAVISGAGALAGGIDNAVETAQEAVTPSINALQVNPVANEKIVAKSANGQSDANSGEDDAAEDTTRVVGTVVAGVAAVVMVAGVTGSVVFSAAINNAINAASAGVAGTAGAAGAADLAAEATAVSNATRKRSLRRLRRRYRVNRESSADSLTNEENLISSSK